MPGERSSWERRAARSGTKLSGVLFRGLSEQANSAVHAWHSWVVTDVFASSLGDRATVLDLGCGYGRLSKVLIEQFPEMTIVGQDLSLSYCRLFSGMGWPCVLAEASALPFADASFDGAMAVTCLMYSDSRKVSRILSDLRRVIKPGGTMLLLDPALELQRVVARVLGQSVCSPTGGRGFAMSDYYRLIGASGFTIMAKGGNPALSAALLVPMVGRTARSWPLQVLDWCSRLDRRQAGYSRLALHRWVLASRGSERA